MFLQQISVSSKDNIHFVLLKVFRGYFSQTYESVHLGLYIQSNCIKHKTFVKYIGNIFAKRSMHVDL